MTYEYFLNRTMDEAFDTAKHTYYLALSTAAPTSAGIAEPSANGTGYVRMKIDAFTDAANGVVSNANAITFPDTTASWGNITHYAVFDAATGGNPLYANALKHSRPMTGPMMQLTIMANELRMTLREAVAT